MLASAGVASRQMVRRGIYTEPCSIRSRHRPCLGTALEISSRLSASDQWRLVEHQVRRVSRRQSLTPSLHGKLDRGGSGRTTLEWHAMEGGSREGRSRCQIENEATGFLIDWLEAREEFLAVRAVGHRVVHGDAASHDAATCHPGTARGAAPRQRPSTPNHLPREIELIEAFRERHPAAAAGGLLRHRLSSPPCRPSPAAADSAALSSRRGSGATGSMVCPTRF